MEEITCCTFCSEEIVQVKNGVKVNETTTTNPNRDSDAMKNISFWRHIYEESVREFGEISGLAKRRGETEMNNASTLTLRFSGGARQEKSRYDLHKSMKMMCGECEKEFENLEQLHNDLLSIKRLMKSQLKKIEIRHSRRSECHGGMCENVDVVPLSMEASVFGTNNILNTLRFLANICESTDTKENVTSKCVQVSLDTMEPDKSTDLITKPTQYGLEETAVETSSYGQISEADSPHTDSVDTCQSELDIGETKVYTEIFPGNDDTVSQRSYEIQTQSNDDNKANLSVDLTTKTPVVVIERLQIESNIGKLISTQMKRIHHDDITDNPVENNVAFQNERNLQVDKPSSNRKVIRIVKVGTRKPPSKKKLYLPNPNGPELRNTHGFTEKFFVGGIPKFRCKCGKIFGVRDSINKHKLRIINGSLFKCTVENCESRFYNTFNLKRHLSSVHGKKKLESNIGCRRCGAMFELKEDFHAHLMEHKKLQK